MKIRLKQVIEAIEMADEAYTAFGDRQTRKPVFLDDPDITGMRNNELGALLNVEPERFYPFPTKYEIHEYGIMESFVEELPSGKARDPLALNSSGTIILRKPTGRPPYAGAGETDWNMKMRRMEGWNRKRF